MSVPLYILRVWREEGRKEGREGREGGEGGREGREGGREKRKAHSEQEDRQCVYVHECEIGTVGGTWLVNTRQAPSDQPLRSLSG